MDATMMDRVGVGAAGPEAMAFCEANGIEVVAGLCSFMALPGAGAFRTASTASSAGTRSVARRLTPEPDGAIPDRPA